MGAHSRNCLPRSRMKLIHLGHARLFFVNRYSSNESRHECEYCEDANENENENENAEWLLSWQLTRTTTLGFSLLDFMLLFAGYIGVTVKHDIVDFATHHVLCRSCSGKIQTMRFVRGLSEFFCRIALFFSLIALGIAVGTFAFYFDEVQRKPVEWSWLLAGSALVVGICTWVMSRSRLFGVTGRFPVLARSPFVFTGLQRTERQE